MFLYAFLEDGAFYSYAVDDADWTRERDISGRTTPLDLVGAETRIYASCPRPGQGAAATRRGTSAKATSSRRRPAQPAAL